MGTMHGVVFVNDMLMAHGTLPLVSRRYIEQYSGCFDVPDVIIYPGYSHNYSENGTGQDGADPRPPGLRCGPRWSTCTP